MRRLFWIALGASAGILVARQARKTAASLTPGAMAGSLSVAIREFGADLREAMAERETELRRDLGLDDAVTREPADPLGAHPFESRLLDGR